MKVSTLEITLEINAKCPHCGEGNDLRERDFDCDYFWSDRAVNRLSGKEMEINESHECFKCGKVFEIKSHEIV